MCLSGKAESQPATPGHDRLVALIECDVYQKQPMTIVVCAATGPSFTAGQARVIEQARDRDACRVIAINDNWRLLPHADILYACDGNWWDLHLDSITQAEFAGELWTQDTKAADRHDLCYIKGESGKGLALSPDRINTNASSGHQAINLAYHMDATHIVLVGYDCQRTEGKSHWFGDHVKGLSRSHPYRLWLSNYAALAVDLQTQGVRITNCTLQSAITCFPRGDLEAILG